MDETILLADGTLIENAHCLESSGMLFIYIQGTEDMRKYFDLLIDPEKTATIIYTMNNGDNKRYSGFTKLTAVTDEGNGLITAVLQKS